MARRGASTAAVLLFCIIGSLLFLAALKAGEAGMCRYGDDRSQAYCQVTR